MKSERVNTHKGNNWFAPENVGSKEWRASAEKKKNELSAAQGENDSF